MPHEVLLSRSENVHQCMYVSHSNVPVFHLSVCVVRISVSRVVSLSPSSRRTGGQKEREAEEGSKEKEVRERGIDRDREKHADSLAMIFALCSFLSVLGRMQIVEALMAE